MEETGGRSRGRCRLRQVKGGSAPGERAMEEPGSRSRGRGRCRLGQVQGALAPGEGAVEEPGGQSRGRCRFGQLQGGLCFNLKGESAKKWPSEIFKYSKSKMCRSI